MTVTGPTLERVKEAFQSLVIDPANGNTLLFQPGETIAYFSMEFGLHESLPLFAGGLGSWPVII